MKKKNLIISTACVGFVALLYTILVAIVDKNPIGPNNSYVGFSTINGFFKELIGENGTFYTITKYTGILIILVALGYLIYAAIEWLKRKSFKKIDIELIVFGIFCIAVAIIYTFFELIKINYRPILIDGKLEPSYPSSHTLLAVFICIASTFINNKIISNKNTRTICNTFVLCIGAITIIGRIASGVHWITDIVGGILISTSLVIGYALVLEIIKTRKQKDEQINVENNNSQIEKIENTNDNTIKTRKNKKAKKDQ